MKLETGNLGRQELHELISAALAPLPIAFISTVGPDGKYNAAPFSFVTPVSSKPLILCVSIGHRQGQKKDTLKNIEFSHDFVVNIVDESIIKQAVQASANYPYGVDEIKENGLTAIKGEKVKSPRIAEAKVNLECRFVQQVELIEEYRDGTGPRAIIFGEVVMAHVKDEVWINGRIDQSRLKTIGRMGSNQYCRTEEIFEVKAAEIR